MRNYFTLAGVDSRTFGVYISVQQTFNSPEKSYEEYDIPGRNGMLLGSNRKFENVECIYEAFIYADFEKNMAAFRSFLASLDGYARLEDTCHPDEYRMAVLSEGIEPEVTRKNNAAQFKIVFSCLPERYLISGASAYSPVAGSVSGESVRTDFAAATVSRMRIAVDQPIPVKQSTALTNVSFDPLDTLNLYFNGEKIWSKAIPAGTMRGEFDVFNGGTITAHVVDLPLTGWAKDANYGSWYYLPLSVTGAVLGCNFAALIDSASTWKTVGKCWHDGENFYVIAPAQLTTLEAFLAWLALQNPQVVEETYQQVVWKDVLFELPTTWGVLSTDSGKVILNIEASNILTNPTPFPSKPLIRIYGTGTLTVNDITITVTDCDQYVDIDCELMDCYEGDTNRNGDVIFSTYDFPTLQPGDNTFVLSGPSGVQVTPRWWRL